MRCPRLLMFFPTVESNKPWKPLELKTQCKCGPGFFLESSHTANFRGAVPESSGTPRSSIGCTWEPGSLRSLALCLLGMSRA